MNDNDFELKKKLKPFMDALSSRLSTRMCIRNNIEVLLSLREEGYKIDDLIEVSGCSYSRQTFSSTLCEAKKKIVNINKDIKVKDAVTSPEAENKKRKRGEFSFNLAPDTKEEQDRKREMDEWSWNPTPDKEKLARLYRKTTSPLNSEETINELYHSLGYQISERTLNKINKLNLTKQDVIEFNMPNEMRLSNYLNELVRVRKRT